MKRNKNKKKRDHYDRERRKETERERKHEETLIRHKKMFVWFVFFNCTMSFSVHFRFIEKNPPDFFFPVGAC
jgi:hypothetical protein